MTQLSRQSTRSLLRGLVWAFLLLPSDGRAEQPLLVDATDRFGGALFQHRVFPSGEKFMPENMGAGVAIFDYDGDGRLDLYFVQGAPAGATEAPPAEAANRLLRQNEEGRFEDVTEDAGVGDRGVGMGVAVGDFDDDGAPDLYVTNFGANVLYRNQGDGTFADVTAHAGIGGDSWSTGAAFVDIDSDGDLDIYAAAYLEWTAETNRFCGNAQTGLRAYCHPDLYSGQPDSLYLNEGGGRFSDSSALLLRGTDSRGLGVATLDADDDGRVDLYVANDTTANHLYLQGEGGSLEEAGLLAGVAVNGAGKGEAGMGIAIGDTVGDGVEEIFVTHLDEETNTLYRPLAPGVFSDATENAGLATTSLPWVGFGVRMLDVDLDADLDLLIVNGHIIDNISAFDSSLVHRQAPQLMLNDGTGRFSEHPQGLAGTAPLVARGLATGDLDRDGDQDVVVTQNGGPALLLDNTSGAAGSAITLEVRAPNAGSWTGRWAGTSAGTVQVRRLSRAPGYLSQSAPQIVFVSSGESLDARQDGRWAHSRRFRALRPGRRYAVLPLH